MLSLGEGKRSSLKKLSIEYCGTCNYRPIAAGLSRAVEKETGMKAVLMHSHVLGVFEVRVDGELIFSKKESGRFPEHSEIIALLKKKNSSGNKTSFGKKGL